VTKRLTGSQEVEESRAPNPEAEPRALNPQVVQPARADKDRFPKPSIPDEEIEATGELLAKLLKVPKDEVEKK
jgi:hypothetical protein